MIPRVRFCSLALLVSTLTLSAQTFTLTGSMNFEREYHTATLLPNGKVLIAGGADDIGHTVSTSEIYDPVSHSFSIGPNMYRGRWNHTATLLGNGTVLIAGGQTGGSNGVINSAELYLPSTNQFVATGSLHEARAYHVAAATVDGRAVIAAGYGPAGSTLPNVYKNTVEIYDPNTGQFTSGGTLPLTPRAHASGTLLASGEILITGGQNGSTPLADAAAYNPTTRTSRMVGSMTVGRQYHTLTLLNDGRVLVVGGYAAVQQTFYPVAELFDPQSSTFSATGSMAHGRYWHTATLLPDSRVLIAGGIDGTGTYTSPAEIYDPMSGVFSATSMLKHFRDEHTATLLPDGEVLLAGGDDDTTASINSAETFALTPTTTSMTSSLNASPTTAHPGELLQFVLGINNTGSIAATNVQARLSLGSLLFVSSSGNGWSCSYSSPNVTCTQSSLAVGTGPDITITARAAAPGTYNSTATVTASNTNAPATANVTVSVVAHQTQTTLSSTNVQARAGESIQFRAQVTAGSAIAVGAVTFYDGSKTIGTIPLDAGGLAILTTSALGAGTHTITANYSGSDDFMPSASAPLLQQITQLPSRRRAAGR